MLLALRSRHEVEINVVCIGIASEEAFGSPTIYIKRIGDVIRRVPKHDIYSRRLPAPITISLTGIESKSRVGKADISVSIEAKSIRSLSRVNKPQITLGIAPRSVYSSEVLGRPKLGLNLVVEGVLSEEDVGITLIWSPIIAEGVSTQEFIGNPYIEVDIFAEYQRLKRYQEEEIKILLMAA